MRQMVRHEMRSLPQRPPKNPLGHTAHLAEPQEEDFLPSRIRPPLGAKLRSAQLGVERICHMVDIAATQPGIIQTETDRMLGKLVRVVDVRLLTVLDAVEPLLLGGGDERAVDDQRGGGLVIHRVDSENVHRPKTRDMRFLRASDRRIALSSRPLRCGISTRPLYGRRSVEPVPCVLPRPRRGPRS